MAFSSARPGRAPAAETIAPAGPTAATQSQPVILGTDNTGATARTGIFTTACSPPFKMFMSATFRVSTLEHGQPRPAACRAGFAGLGGGVVVSLSRLPR